MRSQCQLERRCLNSRLRNEYRCRERTMLCWNVRMAISLGAEILCFGDHHYHNFQPQQAVDHHVERKQQGLCQREVADCQLHRVPPHRYLRWRRQAHPKTPIQWNLSTYLSKTENTESVMEAWDNRYPTICWPHLFSDAGGNQCDHRWCWWFHPLTLQYNRASWLQQA